MGTPLQHVNEGLTCTHGAPAQVISANARVLVSGQPVALQTDTFVVTGCPFVVASAPSPCVKLQWLVPSARVRVMGQPVLVQTSTGLCLAATQAPQGPPMVIATQPRVLAL